MYLCIVCKISSYNILYIHYSLLFFPPESSSLPNMGHLQRRGGGDPRGQQTVRIHQLLDHALHLMRSATTEKTHGKQLLSYCKSGRTWVPTGFLQSVWPKRTLSVHKHMTTYVNLPSIFLPNMSIYIYIYIHTQCACIQQPLPHPTNNHSCRLLRISAKTRHRSFICWMPKRPELVQQKSAVPWAKTKKMIHVTPISCLNLQVSS